jgi:hypothetical protein
MKSLGFDFGVEATHPISEDQPDLFHPHVNLLWIRKSGLSAHLSDTELKDLKAFWAQLIGVPYAVVNHRYKGFDHPKKIMHWSKYVARPFPGFSSWQGPIRWYGKFPKMPPEVYVCPHCHQCYVVIDRHVLHSEYLEEQLERINTT